MPEADLWCSYAAVRTLRWLGGAPADPDAVAAFLLGRRNADGGYAWQRGLPSDIWATYYCTQSLVDLGRPVPDTDRLADWLPRLRAADGGFGMSPGQPPDVWATYYATRTYAEVLGVPVPDVPGLGRWLASCQHERAGVAWQPGSRQPDVRAGYYAALAWRAAAGSAPVPVHRAGLVDWLRQRQDDSGGMAFTPGAQPCSWAAFRGVRALAALGAAPADPAGLRRWLAARRLSDGGYERWTGYGRTDVWSCFTTVGALQTLANEAPVPARPDDRADLPDLPDLPDRARLVDLVRGYQLPGSGFTYRAPEAAGDSLATAATLLRTQPGDQRAGSLADWLRAAQLPYEDGVMYMPGRGAEMRCTLWAVAALRAHGRRLDVDRLRGWLRDLQNVDGGFGYWHGRGSDLTSTVSALETAYLAGLDLAATLDVPAVRRFLTGPANPHLPGPLRADPAAGPGHTGTSPAAGPTGPTVIGTAQTARALALLGEPGRGRDLAGTLTRWASPLGGYAAVARAVPDLLSTYQAVLTSTVFGLPVDRPALHRFLAKVRAGTGYAWSPLSREPAGPLAGCLGAALAAFVDDDAPAGGALPRLNL
ncbi:hypothetical protein GCM10027605_06060 [Micromonospora zhanjiangensis]